MCEEYLHFLRVSVRVRDEDIVVQAERLQNAHPYCRFKNGHKSFDGIQHLFFASVSFPERKWLRVEKLRR